MRLEPLTRRQGLLILVPFIVVGFVLDLLHVTRAYVPVWIGVLVLVTFAVSIRRREP